MAPGTIRGVIFDLDETLIENQALAEAGLVATCATVDNGREAEEIAASVSAAARRLWQESPHHAFCQQLGMAWWEGLLSREPGTGVKAARLKGWLSRFRDQAWEAGLVAAGVDRRLAERLCADYMARRPALFAPFPAAGRLLADLRKKRARLGLLTNGPSDVQHEKIDAMGLGRFFDAVVVSGDLGIGKPDPRAFARALAEMGTDPQESVMVGDSWQRDVAGAHRSGLAAIWIAASPPPSRLEPEPDFTVKDLEVAGQVLLSLMSKEA